MPHLIAETVHSIESFVAYQQPWNELWDNSNGYEPLSRCEGIALWHREFAREESFAAILIWDGEQLVGGLPLLQKRSSRIDLLALPANEWVTAGELLVRDGFGIELIIAKIIEQLKTFKEAILCFDEVRFETDVWEMLVSQLKSASGNAGVLRPTTVGLIEIGQHWEQYFQGLSGNHRSSVRRAEKKARRAGDLTLLRLQDLSAEQCRTWMTRAFEIEHRSWKRENGTSILAEGMSEYFLAEAEFARQAGMLELWFLQLDDEPIAFEYCHRVKDVCFSYKIGYDEAFKNLAPGKVLRKLQLEMLYEVAPGSILDTKGILCQTKAKWATSAYQKGRLVMATQGRIPQLLLGAYLRARPIVQRFRGIDGSPAMIDLGGAPLR